MTAPAPAVAEPARPVRSPWFRSATFDLLLILGVPFVTWPLLMAAQGAWGAKLLTQLILLTATGHYFATFVRTYGDRELFERFRTRFVLAPIVLLVVCLSLFLNGAAAPLLLVTAGWAFWHWLAQAFGFARIYDIKVGSFRPLTVWLDKALVITGFVGAVTLNPGSIATFGKVFLDAGIPLPTAESFAVVQTVVIAAMILVGTAYVGNLAWTIARGEPWSWQKQFMHVTTIGYYWFAFAWLPNVLVAYVLYELFHDVQYYAITWLTCRHRVQRPGVTPWLAAMFRPGLISAALFVLLMTAFGALDFGGRHLGDGDVFKQVSLAVFLTAALLHYYYDGFIWKARESALGSDLGIQGGLRAAVVPGLRHAGRWALFFVPLAVVFACRQEFTPRERAESLVALVPGDFLSQADLGFELTRAREIPAALDHYRASVAANPDYSEARANFGAALEFAGDLDGAKEQYEHALRCPDQGGAHARAHVNLGVLLLMRGNDAAAHEHFAAGRRLGGDEPMQRIMGLAAAIPTDAVAQRLQLYAAALKLDPRQSDAHFNLANLLLARHECRAAADHYRSLLEILPNFVPGLVGLAQAQLELGEPGAARKSVDLALQRDPENPKALALQTQLGGY